MTALENYKREQERKLERSKLQSALSKFGKVKQKRKKPKKKEKRKKLSAKERYKIFLKSKYWKAVRESVLIRDNFYCRGCGSKDNLQVHHLTYKNHSKEHLHLEDLITFCGDCHEKEHEGSGGKNE